MAENDGLAVRVQPPGHVSVLAARDGEDAEREPDFAALLEEGADDDDDDDAPGGVSLVTEDQVRKALEQLSGFLNRTTADEVTKTIEPDLWLFDPDDLAELVPPLTRVVNKAELAWSVYMRRAIHASDYAVIAELLGGWAVTNATTTAQLKLHRRRGRTQQAELPAAAEKEATSDEQ